MAAPMTGNLNPSPSAFKIQHSSPLDTLVRKTSVRTKSQSPNNQSAVSHAQSQQYVPQQYISTPPKLHQGQPPASPLLHSHFSRESTATASSHGNNSYLNRTSNASYYDDQYQEVAYHYYDDESIYSEPSPALRDSWQSTQSTQSAQTARPDDVYVGNRGEQYASIPDSPLSSRSPVPTVIVSSADSEPTVGYSGRAPIVARTNANFSRPLRPSGLSPALPSEEQKRLVLERNAKRTPSSTNLHTSSYSTIPSTQPLNRSTSRSPSPASTRTLSPSPSSQYLVPAPSSSSSRLGPPPTTTTHPTPQSIQLPRRPPSLRPTSPTSIYSSYSFYQLDSASPTGESQFPTQNSRPNPRELTPSSSPTKPMTTTPQDFLQLGIQHHEANRLKDSAVCFEKSATVQGGCGVGMLMWGLTLRHGWGCEKNEKSGFKWLRKAAENAVEDLEKARSGGRMDANAVQSELVLAIYEVGQCFFQGWGVTKDQKMAVSYYRVAARLGDADAQSDLAFCLTNGKGCKKDRKEAAKWYRAAVAQGASDVGLAWIYKEKFQ